MSDTSGWVSHLTLWHKFIKRSLSLSQAAAADYFYYTSNGFSRNAYDIGADTHDSASSMVLETR